MASNSLPFVTAPAKATKQQIGNDVIGIVELPVLSSLKIGEVITTNALLEGTDAEGGKALIQVTRLAQRISTERKMSITEAFSAIEASLLSQEISEDQHQLKALYLEEFVELSQTYSTQGQTRIIASVTSLIRHRLKRPDWTMEQTRDLPNDLVDSLFQFYERERLSGDPIDGAPRTEEELKKSQPETVEASP
ncbi:MAG: hypothetical protein QGG29_08710 [Prochlorococcaceae cyanobacterium ETNP18_MAG_17]|jgi:hypothetical protein|nr:hypothetical protein [Prochlorococcaceae cyanobacterium ETNP18_MAG_17]